MPGGIMCGKESGDALIFDIHWGYHCPLSRTGDTIKGCMWEI